MNGSRCSLDLGILYTTFYHSNLQLQKYQWINWKILSWQLILQLANSDLHGSQTICILLTTTNISTNHFSIKSLLSRPARKLDQLNKLVNSGDRQWTSLYADSIKSLLTCSSLYRCITHQMHRVFYNSLYIFNLHWFLYRNCYNLKNVTSSQPCWFLNTKTAFCYWINCN